MEITCYRDQELASETRFLPAATYNQALTLLARSASGNLFVPIRAMQYLAILDHEEWVFLDGERKCWVDIAWRQFRPQARASLEEPVQYEAAFYHENAGDLMVRLLAELPRALQDLAKKARVEGPARVLKFPAPKSTQENS
ncbi:MAG: hypothetical protein IV108_01005 [Burkholderiales bacterium]|nr:hypothetical protein [Burkholderiales bacterium]